ncbi:MAG TPA: BatA domain-containing protein, partial [Burkholderiales bacterium]|nr:BatA domain-containing protein [Burkholderiales bacterium]
MSFLAQLRQTTMLWPEGLWLLAVLPVLIAMYVWLGRRHQRVHARLAGLWQSDRSVRSAFRRALPPFLFLLGLAALITAVGRPQAVLTLPSVHKSVMLAIDTSGSMRATDVKPSRLAA